METGLITSTDFEKLLLPVRERALKLVDETTFIREAGFALQQINGSKQLLGADKQSVLQAVYNVALTGLSLNPVHKLAYLIPRYKQGRVMASLEPSYQGLVKLLTDTKSVKNVYAYPVFEGDEFEVTLGTSIEIKHSPKFATKKLIKVYAVAILHDDRKQIEVMTDEDVNAIRDKSESYMAFKDGKIKSCIWEDNYSEMCRKTVIKRISKYLPKTDQWEKFNEAVQIDNEDYIVGLDNDNGPMTCLGGCGKKYGRNIRQEFARDRFIRPDLSSLTEYRNQVSVREIPSELKELKNLEN